MADTKDQNPKASSSTTKDAGDDAGQAEVQRIESDAEAKGFYGEVPDETPNEGYSLRGSVQAAKDAAAKADQK